jgi:two-component system, OmpR family, KDP operon response regulator KdpE
MKTILIVDDEPQIRRALSLNLGARGYNVIEATTGSAALDLARAEHPDLVLLDLGLPDMDGIVVLDSIRHWSSVAVIVLTVRDDERSKVAAFEAGADDYVTKPFDMAELADRIAGVLRRDSDAAQDRPESPGSRRQ